jgi:hypothetical protein
VLAFGISGWIHQRSEALCGVPAHEQTALWFFGLQPLGIVVETAVAAAYRAAVPPARRLPRFVERAVGHVWTVAFMLWLAPNWTFPIMRSVVPGRDRVVPVGVVGRFVDLSALQ